MKNIYVGNLDFNVSEDELRQAFAAYGQVENVTVLKDRDTGQPRGFGFVEMANDEEAEKAISAMNGYQLGSRALNVNEARPKTGGGGGGFSSPVAEEDPPVAAVVVLAVVAVAGEEAAIAEAVGRRSQILKIASAKKDAGF